MFLLNVGYLKLIDTAIGVQVAKLNAKYNKVNVSIHDIVT